MTARGTFFPSVSSDDKMESSNWMFWRAMMEHIEADSTDTVVDSIVDVGSHAGGFLALVQERWPISVGFGIEPIEALRRVAKSRLALSRASFQILDPDAWPSISSQSIAIVTGQEVLYLIQDIPIVLAHVARVLRPGGRAYFTLGMHTENPLWPAWSNKLVGMGIPVFGHSPMAILGAASAAGLSAAVRPLRADGWVIHNPLEATFPVPTVSSLLEHHFRHKLLFRFEKP